MLRWLLIKSLTSKVAAFVEKEISLGLIILQFNLGIGKVGALREKTKIVTWYGTSKIIKLLHALAEQGNLDAQFNLGFLYEKGKGVQQDFGKALKLYRLAAEKGDTTAQFNIGIMHCQGFGTPQDFVKAYYWFEVATLAGDKTAEVARFLTAKKLSTAEIVEAERQAEKYFYP